MWVVGVDGGENSPKSGWLSDAVWDCDMEPGWEQVMQLDLEPAPSCLSLIPAARKKSVSRWGSLFCLWCLYREINIFWYEAECLCDRETIVTTSKYNSMSCTGCELQGNAQKVKKVKSRTKQISRWKEQAAEEEEREGRKDEGNPQQKSC